jgi:hypothetical protein
MPTTELLPGLASSAIPGDMGLAHGSAGSQAGAGKPAWPSGHSVLAWSLGIVLLSAAALKGQQLLTDFVPGKTLYTARWFQTLTVEIELALGLWMITGLYRPIAARFALFYFVILAGASGYMVAAGVECCGCLGRLAVSPWFTFAFNLAAVCGLVVIPPPAAPAPTFRSHPYRALTALALFAFAGVYLVAGAPAPPPALSTLAPTQVVDDGALLVLDVENWQGKLLPILDFLDRPERFRAGPWRLILYHADCAKCMELIAKVKREVGHSGIRTAVIEVPPASGLRLFAVGEPPSWLPRGTLSTGKRWVVTTPVVIEINDGIVIDVKQQPNEVE